jgi:hypothetical protein
MRTKRKRGQFTSSTYSRYRQTPILLKRVNAHAERRELSTSVLAIFFNFADFGIQESKVDVHPICPFINLSP